MKAEPRPLHHTGPRHGPTRLSAWEPAAPRGSDGIEDDAIDIVAGVVAIVLVTLIALAC
jgi:hypothetical protein